jgi:3-methyladenine DNA glycosylase Tag
MSDLKYERFKESFAEFHDKDVCDVTVDDWIRLFMEVNIVTRQGSGLLWSEIEDIVKETIR